MVSAADTNNSLPTSTQITKDTSAIQTTTIQNKVITSDNTKYIDTKKTNTTKTTKDTNIQKSSKTINKKNNLQHSPPHEIYLFLIYINLTIFIQLNN